MNQIYWTCIYLSIERPVRTTHRKTTTTTTTHQQQVVPQETIYTTESIHSSHTQFPFRSQQYEQEVPGHYYTSQTINQQSRQPIPQEIVYTTDSTRSTHADISLHHQQPDQRILTQYYTTPQQVSPQAPTSHTFTSFSTQQPKPQQQAPFQPYATQEQPQQPAPQSTIPQAPPLLPSFNIRPNYSDQQVKIVNNVLQDQPLYSGVETIFECQFTGQPDKVQWFRNEVEIVNNPQQVNNR